MLAAYGRPCFVWRDGERSAQQPQVDLTTLFYRDDSPVASLSHVLLPASRSHQLLNHVNEKAEETLAQAVKH